MKCDIYNFWLSHKDELHGYISKRIPDRNDVDDILQAVLIKVTNYCESKNDVIHIKAWMYKITQNTIIDFHKKSIRNTNTEIGYSNLQYHPDYGENVYFWLHKFINRLPDEFSIPLRLSDLKGLPQKDIAKQLGLTLEATKSRIQRARKKVRLKFDECGVLEKPGNHPLEFTITKPCCLAE
ncbi:sigma-70 family RNA polymerase sigma factor [Belliella marina]|uniref:Sigma-70 family RNA polymerase sigma factor n=1 Tax=Belliella marina TaxID=1644146 RepID=A0ABW4VRQ4_9BACT